MRSLGGVATLVRHLSKPRARRASVAFSAVFARAGASCRALGGNRRSCPGLGASYHLPMVTGGRAAVRLPCSTGNPWNRHLAWNLLGMEAMIAELLAGVVLGYVGSIPAAGPLALLVVA